MEEEYAISDISVVLRHLRDTVDIINNRPEEIKSIKYGIESALEILEGLEEHIYALERKNSPQNIPLQMISYNCDKKYVDFWDKLRKAMKNNPQWVRDNILSSAYMYVDVIVEPD